MAFFQQRLWTKLFIMSLYNSGLWILLIVLIIDIVTFLLLLLLFIIVFTKSPIYIFVSIKFFCGLPLGLDSPTKAAFLFAEMTSSSHLARSFTLFSNLLIYSLLKIIICFVYSTQIRKWLLVFELYSTKIPYHIFW